MSASPRGAAFFFFLLTFGYVVYRQTNWATLRKNGSHRLMISLFYLALSVASAFFFTVGYTVDACQSPQYLTACLGTLFPWAFIFGTVWASLIASPGWLSPFANTLGYGLVSLAGVKEVMSQTFKARTDIDESKGSLQSQEMARALNFIYGNESLLINEITTENFNKFWSSMEPLIKPNADRNKLLALVELKENAAMFVWYLLAGTLAIVVSFHYAMSAVCNISAAEMERRHREYENVLAKQSADSKKPVRVYTTRD